MILREKHNQESATFKRYWVTDWDALHFFVGYLGKYLQFDLFNPLGIKFILGMQ